MAPQNHPIKLVSSVFPILIRTLNGVDQLHDQRFVPPANHCKQFRKLSYGRFYRFDAWTAISATTCWKPPTPWEDATPSFGVTMTSNSKRSTSAKHGMRSRSWFRHRKMWNVFLQRKRTPPRKSWPAKWISPRIFPMLGGIFGGFLSSTNNRKLVAFTSKISWNASAIMLQSCYIMVYIQKSCWQHNENDLAMTFLKPVEWKWNRNEPSGAEKDWKSGEQDRCWLHIYCDHSLPHCIKGWGTGKTRYHYDGTMPRKN